MARAVSCFRPWVDLPRRMLLVKTFLVKVSPSESRFWMGSDCGGSACGSRTPPARTLLGCLLVGHQAHVILINRMATVPSHANPDPRVLDVFAKSKKQCVDGAPPVPIAEKSHANVTEAFVLLRDKLAVSTAEPSTPNTSTGSGRTSSAMDTSKANRQVRESFG